MGFAILADGQWSEIVGGFTSGTEGDLINHPSGWIDAVSLEEATEYGVYPIAEDDVPGDDVRVVERRLGDRDGRPVWVYVTEPAPDEPVAVPASVTPRQLRLALHFAGKLDQVEAFVTGGQAPPEAVISWEYATEFLRSDPMLGQFAAMLGMTDDDVDGLFIAAAQIP